MDQQQTVIYTARNKQQAHLLKNLLEEVGIEAIVTGDVLSDGTGVDAVGWATAARVVVDQRDAATARRYVEEFERQAGAEADESAAVPASDSPAEYAEWPTCPECDARRTATCPICHTSDTEFAQADPDFVGLLEPPTEAAATSCGCGSGGCSSKGADSCEAPDSESVADGAEERPQGLVLMCSTCDEPFEPEFPRRCTWCGHEFPDGYEVDVQEGPPPEEVTTRALVVMVALGLMAIALISYFLFLAPAGN